MTYDYKCDACGTTYSIERSIHEEVIAPICTSCSQSMSRVWSSPGITFKGGGFYSTGG